MRNNRSMTIHMKDKDGTVYKWTVRHFVGATQFVLGKKPRHFSGWEYEDHEGCTRVVEGNWLDLVDAFKRTAENYCFTHTLS